jgi:ligand-binding SRPBCC domain-containing protein
MAAVSVTAPIAAPLAEVWDLYFDPQRWRAWVDQFAAVVDVDPNYPAAGSELVWRSGPAGRGEVREEVLVHEQLARHRIRFSDPASTGELTTTFAGEGGETTVTLEMSYELVSSGLFAKISDALFVRSQMRSSLARTLAVLKAEAEADSQVGSAPT